MRPNPGFHEITELEMIRMCARAMGLEFTESDEKLTLATGERYDPINNDDQAWYLQSQFDLVIEDGVSGQTYKDYWKATLTGELRDGGTYIRSAIKPTRNAAIVAVIGNDLRGHVSSVAGGQP